MYVCKLQYISMQNDMLTAGPSVMSAGTETRNNNLPNVVAFPKHPVNKLPDCWFIDGFCHVSYYSKHQYFAFLFYSDSGAKYLHASLLSRSLLAVFLSRTSTTSGFALRLCALLEFNMAEVSLWHVLSSFVQLFTDVPNISLFRIL